MNQGLPKILYVITKANWGGAQRYVFDLASHAKSEGYEAVVVSGARGELRERLRAEKIRTIEIPSLGRDISFWNDLRSFFSLIRIFWSEKPNIVHLNSSKIGGLGALAARISRVPRIIFTAHGWPFLERRSPLALHTIRALSWLTILLSTHVIDISKATREKARTLPYVREKLYMIYNGIDPKEPLLGRSESQEKLAYAIGKDSDFFSGKVIVGTISELTPNKGLEYLISAAGASKDVPALFIIIGEGEDRAKLENMIRAQGVTHKVFLAGFIPEASHYLPGLDIFTLTSIKEGFPFSILEAGRAHLPVVASAVGGIPEILDDATGVLTRPGDSKAIARALHILIENRVAREILGKNLYELVAQKFTKESMQDNTFALYKDTTKPATERSTGVLVKNYDGRFLLNKRDNHAPTMRGEWSFLGGACLAQESEKEAAEREVKEETNLTVKNLRVLEEGRHTRETTIFYGEVDTRNEEMILGEGAELRFFTKEELEAHIKGLPYSNVALKAILRHLPRLA